MADFYGTDTGLTAYATATGRAVPTPTSPDTVNGALFRASTFLDATWAKRFSGAKTGGRNQLRAVPRIGFYDREGILIDDDVTPIEVEYATYELTFQELASPGSLQPVVVPADTIKKVKVEGAIEVEYANVGTEDRAAYVSVVEGILEPLFYSIVDYSGGFFGTTVRI